MNPSLAIEEHNADICVVGGGMAGLIAAVAAARRGSRVVLVHDRPVLGGNASSEVRMWICGAHGQHKKETGLLDEIQLCNAHRNPGGIYSIWDSVLFEYARMTPGLETLLNCSCNDARMEDGRLVSIDAWQLTTQKWHRVQARYFIDCSGDSILAPLSGADTRHGRESREEFGESLAPSHTDRKTMGNTLLLQLEETPVAQAFHPPNWAYRFDKDSTLPSRVGDGFGHNFWWLELGGLSDTIADAEVIRDELVKTAWGVWDYMKNRGPQAEKLKNWRLRWLGSLPGKRENRRYLGPHILTQNEVEAEGRFEDIVAYGGWSMDDHHPAGLLYPGKPTIFHKAPSPYGIPFRSLHSMNVPNLFCAGRNISVTHYALSSTRVMATCAVIGQAAGTAAALCNERSIEPGGISGALLRELQTRLMEDDCWLPGLGKPVVPLMREARLESSAGGDLEALRNGHERPIGDAHNDWRAPAGSSLTMTWPSPRQVDCLRLVFDSDLSATKSMPCRYPLGSDPLKMPPTLVRAFQVEVQDAGGTWEVIHREEENKRRLVILAVRREIAAIRWTGHSTWGDPLLRVFSIEARQEPLALTADPPDGIPWTQLVENMPAADLAAPEHGLESAQAGRSRIGA